MKQHVVKKQSAVDRLVRRSIGLAMAAVMAVTGVVVLAPHGPASAGPVGSLGYQVADPIDTDAPREQFGIVGPRITPGVDEIQVVGLETWLAIDPASFEERTWTKNGVDYRSVPRATIWQFTDRTIRCDGPGVEYTPGAAGPAPCGRDWDHTTAVGPMTMVVTVEYEIFWEYEEQIPPPPPPPEPEPEYDEDGNEIEPPPTLPPPPPPPPIVHSGSYLEQSLPGAWELRVGEIQTNGIDGDAPTPVSNDGPDGDGQRTDRVPGTVDQGGPSPIDAIDCGSRWNLLYWGACEGFKWAIKKIPGIETVFSLVEGCFENVTDFVSAITNLGKEALAALDNPVRYFEEKIEQFQALIEAVRTDPRAFAAEFLGDTFELDLLEEDPAKWIGKVGCQIALAVLTGGGQLATKLLKRTDDILDWITRKKRDRSDNDSDRDGDPAPTCRTNSFPTGTPVLMADGSHRPIDLIEPGDVVLAADPTTGVWSARTVLDQWSHPDDGHLATATLTDGSSITATDDHEFWVEDDGAWTELDDVEAGDLLLTPNGPVEVAAVAVGERSSTLVWELDVDVDDTFGVHTGTHTVLVHNKDCAPGDLTAADMMDPSFKVPRGDDFAAWFDALDPDEFAEAFAGSTRFRNRVKTQIRKPGGLHEWCICSRAPTLRRWGVSMNEIKAFRSETRGLTWVRPHPTDPKHPGFPGQHIGPDGQRPIDSHLFHQEIERIIDGSDDIDEFNTKIAQMWDEWQVPESHRPPQFPVAG